MAEPPKRPQNAYFKFRAQKLAEGVKTSEIKGLYEKMDPAVLEKMKDEFHKEMEKWKVANEAYEAKHGKPEKKERRSKSKDRESSSHKEKGGKGKKQEEKAGKADKKGDSKDAKKDAKSKPKDGKSNSKKWFPQPFIHIN